MKIEKHIQALINLLKDISKEPSPAVIGFAYSVALTHMFMIAFNKYIDPCRAIKHTDFASVKGSEKLNAMIPDFEDKERLFLAWREMENKRNELCYGHPSEKDVEDYCKKFQTIKKILEKVWETPFEINILEEMLHE